MASLITLYKDKQNILKELTPHEMKDYVKYNVNRLYEAFLKHDEEIALAAKGNIKEATKLYENNGYVNSVAVELGLRLDKANDILVETLVAKHKNEINFYKVILEHKYEDCIGRLTHNNNILKSLIASHEKTHSEELTEAIKDVVFLVESDLIGIKYLLEAKESTEKSNFTYFNESKEILKGYYSEFENLVKKINSF